MPDVRDYLARSAVLVVPLRIGGGMRIKLLDFFSAGKAVVATSIGAEGNMAKDSVHALIRDADVPFADGVAELLSDPSSRSSMGSTARELVMTEYSWKKIAMELTGLYESVISDGVLPSDFAI